MKCPECASDLTKGKKGYICEECGERFSFGQIESSCLDEWQRFIVDNYPSAIAVPFHAMVLADDPTARIKLLVDTFTNVMKLLSLVVLTDYLRSELRDAAVNESVDRLAHPLISYWNWFLSVALPVMKNADIVLSIPEIGEFHERVESKIAKNDRIVLKNGYYDDEGEFVETAGHLVFGPYQLPQFIRSRIQSPGRRRRRKLRPVLSRSGKNTEGHGLDHPL